MHEYGYGDSGQTVAVDPDALRAAAQQLDSAREAFEDNNNQQLLHGIGEHTQISTGGYVAGEAAQVRLSAHHGRMAEVYWTFTTNMMALSSSLNILADVYDTADHAAAIEFAFANPDAGVPDGLPPGFVTDQTFFEAVEAAGDGDAADPAETDDDDDNSVPEGSSHRVTYPHQDHLRHPGDPSYEVRESYDDEGNLVRARHKIVYDDGSALYYTEGYRPDGTMVRFDQMEFGPQGRPARTGEDLNRLIEETQEQFERRTH